MIDRVNVFLSVAAQRHVSVVIVVIRRDTADHLHDGLRARRDDQFVAADAAVVVGNRRHGHNDGRTGRVLVFWHRQHSRGRCNRTATQ